MPFAVTGPFGAVVLGGTTFSTDPEPYEPLNWTKRHSVHMGIGGALTIQDFGMTMKDNTLKLGSGRERFLEESIMLALLTKYQTKGATYTLTDWLQNSFTVFIKDFKPVPFKKGGDTNGATISLWMYTMDLHVLSISQICGVTYTGG